MNNFGQLTLYDFLTMMVIGVLILAPVSVFSEGARIADTTVFFIAAYIIGLCYHKILEAATKKFSNIDCMIHRAFEDVRKKFCPNSMLCMDIVDDDIIKTYYKEYYKLILKGSLGNIPVLEAHVAFIRNLMLIILAYIVLLACECSNISTVTTAVFGESSRCCIIIVLAGILLLLPLIWYSTQMKIHKLVWEGGYFISIIGNTQNQQSKPQIGQSTTAKP